MSEHERKLAESDAYLRKLHAKTAASRPKNVGLVLINNNHKRDKMAHLERDLELSQMSNWTQESQFQNLDAKEKDMIKKKQ